MPKSKLNINRKMKNRRIIPGLAKADEIVLMESSVFPAIYFKKSNYLFIQLRFEMFLNNVKNNVYLVSFPNNCE